MTDKDHYDGLYGQPLRPGGDQNSHTIGESIRKFNEHQARLNNPTTPTTPGGFDSPSLPSPTYVPPSTTSPGSYSGPIFQSKNPAELPSAAELGGCLLGLGMLLTGPVLWPLLYPFSVLAALAVGAGSALGVYLLVPLRTPSPLVILYLAPIVIGLVVLVGASRVDHKLGRYVLYRIPRHVVRLGLIGAVVWHYISDPIRYRPGVPILETIRQSANDPIRLWATVGAVVGFHLLLWHAKTLRSRWHGVLEAIGLRSKSVAISEPGSIVKPGSIFKPIWGPSEE